MNLPRLAAILPCLLLLGATGREAVLLDTLRTSTERQARSEACRELARCGTRDAVPVLAALLDSEELADMARYALEPIPDPAVDEALRAALGRLKGPLQTGVIHSIGARRDPAAASALAALLNDPDVEVARAAATALGNIGTSEAVIVLEKSLSSAAPLLSAVQDGLLRAAEHRLAAGDAATATRVYDGLNAPAHPPAVRTAALRGAILVRGPGGLPLLTAALNDPDDVAFTTALRTAMERPGAETTQALATALKAVPEPRQLQLLKVLGLRADATALPALEDIVRAGVPAARAAAIQSLAQIGSPSAVPLLAAAAADADATVAEAAHSTLAGLPGAEVNAAITALLDQPDSRTRAMAADLVARRRITDALPRLLKLAADADPTLAAAGLKALGDLAGPAEVPALLDLMKRSDKPQAVEKTLVSICTRPTAKIKGEVVILKAVYGAFPDGGRMDVAEKITTLVKGGGDSLPVLNSTFGEPAPGKRKQLRIEFTVNGRPVNQTVEEGDTITLTAPESDPAFAKAFRAALPAAAGPLKASLIRLLRSVAGPEALEAVVGAMTDADPAVRDTAVRALCDWPTPDALPALDALLANPPEPKIKVLALRARLRLIPLQTVAPGAKARRRARRPRPRGPRRGEAAGPRRAGRHPDRGGDGRRGGPAERRNPARGGLPGRDRHRHRPARVARAEPEGHPRQGGCGLRPGTHPRRRPSPFAKTLNPPRRPPTMKTPARLLVLASLFASALTASAKDEDAGWVPLFNGTDLTGWKQEGNGIFKVEDGCLVGTQTDGKGGDLFTEPPSMTTSSAASPTRSSGPPTAASGSATSISSTSSSTPSPSRLQRHAVLPGQALHHRQQGRIAREPRRLERGAHRSAADAPHPLAQRPQGGRVRRHHACQGPLRPAGARRRRPQGHGDPPQAL
jgi:HEAT repeat protein